MNPENVEKWLSKFKKQPVRTSLILLLCLLIICMLAYFKGCFEQTGKQNASPAQNFVNDKTSASAKSEHHTKTDSGQNIINQQTQGNQSPAIATNGDVNINYRTKNEKNN